MYKCVALEFWKRYCQKGLLPSTCFFLRSKIIFKFKNAFMYPMMHRFVRWVRFLRKIQPPPPPTILLPAKTIPFWAAHTYMAYIWEYPLPRGNEALLKSFKRIMDWAQNKRQLGRNSKWKINAIVTDLHKQKLMYFGHLKRREGLEKIILEKKDRWEKRKRKTEKAIGKEGTYRMFSTRY